MRKGVAVRIVLMAAFVLVANMLQKLCNLEIVDRSRLRRQQVFIYFVADFGFFFHNAIMHAAGVTNSQVCLYGYVLHEITLSYMIILCQCVGV